MAENKTHFTDASVEAFLDKIEPEPRRDDARRIARLMEEVTGHQPRMFGPTIIGFDKYHYTYDSGHSGVSCRLGFAPRTGKFALYVSGGYGGHEEMLARLGKHKMTKGCLYINKLADVNEAVLKEIFEWAYGENLKRWP